MCIHADAADATDMTATAADAKADTALTKATAAADVTRMKTAVVILNWNTEGFLKEFLPSLVQSVAKVEGAEVVVADNASTDGSMKVMTEMFPDVRTIILDRNYGFTGGYNRAFDALEKVEAPEYFVLINSDIEVTEDWLIPLEQWMDSHPDCGACAPKLHSFQERDKFEYAGAAGGYIDRYGYPFCRGRVMKRLEEDKGQYDSPADVMWATGACLMVRSSVYRELGGLDERFFAHMEEIDLCWRMQLAGWKVTVVPQSIVYHVGGGTLPATSPFKLQLNYRNNLLMLENNLAKTFALQLYKHGADVEKATEKGMKKARRRIRQRKFLDILSAAAYLVTFKVSCFKAVRKAHKEYGRLRHISGSEEIAAYLIRYGNKVSVKGIYNKSIIFRSLLAGKHIFKKIKLEDFYKI